MHRLSRVAVIAMVLSATIVVVPVGGQGNNANSGAACDRVCLTEMVDTYLSALVAHDPMKVAIARTARFTENTNPMPMGEGLWLGASEAPTEFKIYVPDAGAHQVGFVGVMKEYDNPVMLALRLRVENKQITEIEHIVARGLNQAGLKNLVAPRGALVSDVPADQRVPRDQMLKIANSYYDAIVQGSGKVAPFANDCVRHENGMQTTSNRTGANAPSAGGITSTSAMAKIGALGCASALDTRALSYITGIDLRRLAIADEERGLVFGLSIFRQRGNVRTIKILNVPGVDTMAMNFGPIDLQAAHIFKISGGTIHEIEAMGYTLPYMSRSGWEVSTPERGGARRTTSGAGAPSTTTADSRRR
jgi:hypothetical protein